MPLDSDASKDNDINIFAAPEREAALRKILHVISNSRDNAAPVFEAVLNNAARLCNAEHSLLLMRNSANTHLELVASNTSKSKFVDFIRENPHDLQSKGSFAVKVLNEVNTLRLDDLASEALPSTSEQLSVAAQLEQMRSLLIVPLLEGQHALGVICLYRLRIEPFGESETNLVETFAEHAVIAIENVRQFKELQNRLEREAATKQVLEAIAAQSDDETPVFQTILSCAEKLCKAVASRLFLKDKDKPLLNYVAVSNSEKDAFSSDLILHLDDPTGVSKAVKTASLVHQPDLKKDNLYKKGHPDRIKLVDQEGIRAQLAVPLMRGKEAIGALTLNRDTPGPFSENEIALVESFAAQAVIAIENVRQFKALEELNAELGDRVEEQVKEIERIGKLKRFLPSAVADTVVSKGADHMLSSHRALLGVLFCDIRGFTAFCETAEPEETIEVLQTYHEEMGKLISEHGAGVDHRMGDGIMVLFNDPVPCDDPAREAIKLAIAMHTSMTELSKKWKKLGHRLGFGVGISLGYATVGMVGYEGRYDYTASGTAVNLAARLCDQAEDGEILLSPRAFTAVEDDYTFEATGEVNLKGIREPVEVYRLKRD